jgi:hypothetical protein
LSFPERFFAASPSAHRSPQRSPKNRHRHAFGTRWRPQHHQPTVTAQSVTIFPCRLPMPCCGCARSGPRASHCLSLC